MRKKSLTSRALEVLATQPALQKVARFAADSVDLQLQWLYSTLRQAAPAASGRLLDVGCGRKQFAPLFAPFVTSYVGIEHDTTYATTQSSAPGPKSATSGAAKRSRPAPVATNPEGPDYYYGGGRLPFEDASFDTVLSIQVLEHTPRPWELMQEMSRVLKPGGKMIITAPFTFRIHMEPNDYFRYTPHGLSTLCEQVGIHVENVISQGNLGSVLGHKIGGFLALRVARLGGVGQAMGKMGHEPVMERGPRYWTVPAVVPMLFAIVAGARIVDRLAGDSTESLGYVVVGQKGETPVVGVSSALS